MTLNRIDPASCAKVTGILYAALGLLIGGLMSIFAVLGAALGSGAPDGGGALIGLIFGVGAVIILPIVYGFLGAFTAFVGSVLYNVVAGKVGGIELELT